MSSSPIFMDEDWLVNNLKNKGLLYGDIDPDARVVSQDAIKTGTDIYQKDYDTWAAQQALLEAGVPKQGTAEYQKFLSDWNGVSPNSQLTWNPIGDNPSAPIEFDKNYGALESLWATKPKNLNTVEGSKWKQQWDALAPDEYDYSRTSYDFSGSPVGDQKQFTPSYFKGIDSFDPSNIEQMYGYGKQKLESAPALDPESGGFLSGQFADPLNPLVNGLESDHEKPDAQWGNYNQQVTQAMLSSLYPDIPQDDLSRAAARALINKSKTDDEYFNWGVYDRAGVITNSIGKELAKMGYDAAPKDQVSATLKQIDPNYEAKIQQAVKAHRASDNADDTDGGLGMFSAVLNLIPGMQPLALTLATLNAIETKNPLGLIASLASAGLNLGGLDSFTAADAASQAAQGVSASQIADTLQQSYGLSDTMANIGGLKGVWDGFDMFGSPILNSAAKGAITNAGMSLIGGGDAGDAALWGAVGGGTGAFTNSFVPELTNAFGDVKIAQAVAKVIPETVVSALRNGEVDPKDVAFQAASYYAGINPALAKQLLTIAQKA